MIAPIILPQGTQLRWAWAIEADHAEVWDDLAIELLDAAVNEFDMRIKDDLLVLVLMACERAINAIPGPAFNLEPITERNYLEAAA